MNVLNKQLLFEMTKIPHNIMLHIREAYQCVNYTLFNTNY